MVPPKKLVVVQDWLRSDEDGSFDHRLNDMDIHTHVDSSSASSLLTDINLDSSLRGISKRPVIAVISFSASADMSPIHAD